MKLLIKKGATSYLALIFIQDSSSTVGAGLAGLAFNTSGLVCYRARADDGNAGGTAITLATATRGTWTSGGFVEKDATNMPGWYEFGITNAGLATGSNWCGIHFKGAANMAPLALEIQLVDFDPQDSVRMGMTALPNAAAAASGGLLISGSNAGTTTLGALTITGATTHTGNMVLSDGLTISAPSTTNRAGITVTGNGTGAALSATGGATGQGFLLVGGGTSGDGIKITTTSGHGLNLAPLGSSKHGIFSTGGDAGTSDGIKGAAGTGGVDIRGNLTGNITGTLSTLTTYTGNTPQTGDNFARLGAPAGASVSADIAAVKVDTAAVKVQTDKLTFTVANQVDSNVLDWKSATAPAMTGDAFARLGAPAGASVSADVAAVKAVLPAALSGGFIKADLLAINTDANSAANVAKTTRAICRGTVGSASSTTSIVTSAFTPAGAVADQFKGRVITFDADTTTTALRGQSTDITASSNASTPTLTVTALTTAPASGDSFSVT